MVSDRHHQILLLQLALILANCFALTWLFSSAYFTPTVLSLLVLLAQIFTLIRYLDRTNRAVARFLTTVRFHDFGQSFADPGAPASFRELGLAMEEVIDGLRQARTEKEEQASYLQVLLRHIPVAVIAIDDAGAISLFNNAARRLFGSSGLHHANELRRFDEGVARAIIAIAPGEERLVKASGGDVSAHLNISATSLRLGGNIIKLVSIQDIRESLENRESEAWQNLIRVLNHEIMNSMTPITSLAQTGREGVEHLMTQLESDGSTLEQLQDIRDALETMGKRGAGLMRFVDSYRSLTSLPRVQIRAFRLDSFIERIHRLMAAGFQSAGIPWEGSTSPVSLELNGDAALLEQAVINLLKNALDAVSESPMPAISLTARLGEKGKIIICVQDNGCGMSEEVRRNLFVPFFTTRREGTGVGMSLVQRIVRLQGGQVHVHSSPGNGTAIRLVF